MSIPQRHKTIDVALLAGSVLVGVITAILSYFLHINQYGFALAFLIGSVFYATVRYQGIERPRLEESGWNRDSSDGRVYASTAALIVLTALAVFVHFRTPVGRPPLHFVLVTLAYGTILFDILSLEARKTRVVIVVVMKIVLLSLVFRYVRFFALETMPGFDTHAHLRIASFLAQHGQMPAFAGKYSTTPVWHGIVAATQWLGFGGPTSVFVGIVVPFTVLTAVGGYLLTKELVDRRAGLFAAMLVSVSDMFLLRGVTNITPSSVVIVVAFFALYLLLRARDRPSYVFHLLLLVAFFSHQLSSFVLLVTVISLWFSQLIYTRFLKSQVTDRGSGFAVRFRDTAFLTFAMGFQWYVTPLDDGENFLFDMIERSTRTLTDLLSTSPSGGYTASLAQHGAVSNILYTAGYTMLLAMGIFGALIWLHHSRRTKGRFAWVFTASVVFTMIYPLTFAGLGHLLLPHRILVFFELGLVPLAVVGFRYVYQGVSSTWERTPVSGFALLLVFFMLTTPFVNRASPVYDHDRVVRIGLTDTEVDAVIEAAERAERGQVVYLDSLVYQPSVRTEFREDGVETRARLAGYPTTRAIHPGSYVVVRSYYEQAKKEHSNLDSDTFGLDSTSEGRSKSPLSCDGAEIVYQNAEAAVYRIGSC